MSYEELLNFDESKSTIEDCYDSPHVDLFNYSELSQDITDVFVGLEDESRSELSSLSDSDSRAEALVKPVRKKLVMGNHIQVNDGETQYTCTICNCTFSRKQQIRYHDYCVTGKRPLKCELCGKGFVKKSHLLYHTRTHTGESPFKCGICQKGFKQKAKLERHKRTHENESRLLCFICKKSYSDKDSLRKHEQKHSENTYQCSICKKSYAHKFTLKQHLASHSTPNFVCDVCGKSFLRKNTLNVHEQIHEDNYPFECSSCRRTFRSRKELNRHNIVHDQNNHGHECEICSITCGRRDNLLRHIRNCHLDPCQKKLQKDPEGDRKDEGPSNEGNTVNSSIQGKEGHTNPELKSEENVSIPGPTNSIRGSCAVSQSIVKFYSTKANPEAKGIEPVSAVGLKKKKKSARHRRACKSAKNCSIKNKKTGINKNVIYDDKNIPSFANPDSPEPIELTNLTQQKHSELEWGSTPNLPQTNSHTDAVKKSANDVDTTAGKSLSSQSSSHPSSDSGAPVITQKTSVIMHTDLFKTSVAVANLQREPVIMCLRLPNFPST